MKKERIIVRHHYYYVVKPKETSSFFKRFSFFFKFFFFLVHNFWNTQKSTLFLTSKTLLINRSIELQASTVCSRPRKRRRRRRRWCHIWRRRRLSRRRRPKRASPRVTLNPKPSVLSFLKVQECFWNTTHNKKEKRRHEPLQRTTWRESDANKIKKFGHSVKCDALL